MNTMRLYRTLRAVLAAFVLATACNAAVAQNRSDLWWNANEPGWGLVIIDHQTDFFVLWCTYDAAGAATWYVIPGGTISADRKNFAGNMYTTRVSSDGESSLTEVILVGTASIDFIDPFEEFQEEGALFSLRRTSAPPGFAETRVITRQAFGTGRASWGEGVTEMWWSPEQPGWGVATIQHGSGDVFAVLLTHTFAGLPTFYVVPARRNDRENRAYVSSAFDGTLYSTRARGANGTFDPNSVRAERAATTYLSFTSDSTGRANGMELVLYDGLRMQVPLVPLRFGNLR